MAENKVVALALICIILSVALFGALVVFFQQEADLQIQPDQISKLENEKSTLQTQVENEMSERATLANQLSSLQTDNRELETQIVSLQLEEDELNNKLDELEMEFVSLQTEKLSMETEVMALQTEIEALNEDLLAKQTEIGTLTNQIASLQTDIATLETEILQSYDLGYADGETEGYEGGYLQGIEDATEKGWYLLDPTYDEMDAFLESDQTNQNTYSYPDYVCYDFTADFIANALEAGYRCGFVYIEFDESAHSIVCFNTTDHGLIYIEPQTDAIVTITIGEEYEGYVIEDISIIW